MGQYDQLANAIAPDLRSWFLPWGASNVGTWTPTFVGAGTAGTFTYSALTAGQWMRVGPWVAITGRINITAITVAPVGNLEIGGLPFTSANPAGSGVAGTLNIADQTGITLGAGYTQIGCRVNGSVVKATLTKSGSAVAAAIIQGAALALIGGAAEIVFSGWYQLE